MTNQSYLEKLKDPRWQKKRLEILERDNWTCQNCNNSQNTLNVHHKGYLSLREPWDYPDYLLITLCDKCHTDELEPRQWLELDFLTILKSQYLYVDLERIVTGFISLIANSPNKDSAKVINWIFSHENIFKELEEKYRKQINNPHNIKRGQDNATA